MKKIIAERAQEPDLAAVYELDLHNAKLSSLDLDITACSKLRMLDVSFNTLSCLSDEIFRELTTLVELKAYSNEIDRIGNALRDCAKLEVLQLQNNRLRDIDGLQTLAKLKALHLEGNAIHSIVNLNCNAHLTLLDLSRNQLRKIQGLERLHHLRELRLAHNRITSIENLHGLGKLLELDLSHNLITSAPADVPKMNPWKSLTALQILRLNNNRMSSLALLWPMPHLEELYLQHNMSAYEEGARDRPDRALAPGQPPTPSSRARNSGEAPSSPFLTRVAALFQGLQILDISGNGPGIVQSYDQLSALLQCPDLVELSLEGLCHYSDHRTHCRTIQSYLPNIEVVDGQPIACLDQSMRSSISSRSSFFSASLGGSQLFQKADAPPDAFSPTARPSTPSFGIVTFDSGRPGSARPVRGGVDMGATYSGRPGSRQQAPMMRPHSARTGGFDRVWSMQEATDWHRDLVQALDRVKAASEQRVQNMHRAYSEVFSPGSTTTATAAAAAPEAGARAAAPSPTSAPAALRRERSPTSSPEPTVEAPPGSDRAAATAPAPAAGPDSARNARSTAKRTASGTTAKRAASSGAVKRTASGDAAPPARAPVAPASARTTAAKPDGDRPTDKGRVKSLDAGSRAKKKSLDADGPKPDPILPTLPATCAVTAAAPAPKAAKRGAKRANSSGPPRRTISSPTPPQPSRATSDALARSETARRATPPGLDGWSEKQELVRAASLSALSRATGGAATDLTVDRRKMPTRPPDKAVPHHLPLKLSGSPPRSPPLPFPPSPSGSAVPPSLNASLGASRGRALTPPSPPGPLCATLSLPVALGDPGGVSGDAATGAQPLGPPLRGGSLRRMSHSSQSSGGITPPSRLTPPLASTTPRANSAATPPEHRPEAAARALRQSFSCETQTDGPGGASAAVTRPGTGAGPAEAAAPTGEMCCQTEDVVERLPADTPRAANRPLLSAGAFPAVDSSSGSDSGPDSPPRDVTPPGAAAATLPTAGPPAVATADRLVVRDPLTPRAAADASPVPESEGVPGPAVAALGGQEGVPFAETQQKRAAPAPAADAEESENADVQRHVVAGLCYKKSVLRGAITQEEKQGYTAFSTPRQSASFGAAENSRLPTRPTSSSGRRPTSAMSQRTATSDSPSPSGPQSVVSTRSRKSSTASHGPATLRGKAPPTPRNLNQRGNEEKQGYTAFSTPRQSASFGAAENSRLPTRPTSSSGRRPTSAMSQRTATSDSPSPSGPQSVVSTRSRKSSTASHGPATLRGKAPPTPRNLNQRRR